MARAQRIICFLLFLPLSVDVNYQGEKKNDLYLRKQNKKIINIFPFKVLFLEMVSTQKNKPEYLKSSYF